MTKAAILCRVTQAQPASPGPLVSQERGETEEIEETQAGMENQAFQ